MLHKIERSENMETVEKNDKPAESKEKMMHKIKDFFGIEKKESETNESDKNNDFHKIKEENTIEELRRKNTPEYRAELEKTWREKTNENRSDFDKKTDTSDVSDGDACSEHGEDGERTKFSDRRYEQKSRDDEWER